MNFTLINRIGVSIFSILLWYVVSAQAHSYAVGGPCPAENNNCRYPDMCITNPAVTGGSVCSCRLFHLRGNMTWKTNFTSCTSNYSSWGAHPMEKGKVVGFPFYDYERMPEFSFESNGEYENQFLARYARLYSYENRKGAWCAPTAPKLAPSGEEYYLLVDLGNISRVSGVATQGRAGVSIDMVVTKYRLQYATSNTSFITLMNGAAPHEFQGNEKNNIAVYNWITPYLQARYLKFIPMLFKNIKCMRVDVFGLKLINECINGWHRCDKKAKCTNTIDSYFCTCPAGYFDALENGFVCIQINECFDRRPSFRHNCSTYSDCKDLDGSFSCTCHDGFHGDGYYCEDTNECLKPPPANPGYWCKPLAECINTFGGMECRCRLGYTGDPDACKDVNECKKVPNCHADAHCTNTEGSYTCKCRIGYEGNGFKCVDINECLSNPCHKDATCGNTPGSYSCVCKSGFRGSGRWCEDIDECTTLTNPCKDAALCYNFAGSYYCMCPKVMVMQRPYLSTERDILDHILMNFRNSSDDWRYPLDYHAHVIRTLYELIMRTYKYHFKEVTDSFFYTMSASNHFAVEMYDLRCSDVANVSFPNLCHPHYDDTLFTDFTDVVDMWLIEKAEEPFEVWATSPPPTPPKPQAEITTPASTTSTPIPTRIVDVNGMNVSMTYPPPTTPPPYTNCKYFLNGTKGGTFRSPNFPRNYPPNAYCVWTIEAPENHGVYVRFTFFEMEESKNCFYDNVEIRDESEKGELLARYCGSGILFKPAVRSGRRRLVVIFYSDLIIEKKGFYVIWNTLKPRVSLTCITYNQMSSMPESYVKTWKDQIEDETDKSQFVPVSRLLACKQYPRCNHTRPGDVIFTFEHIRTDRNVKKCVHWMLDKIATSFSERPCDVIKTNKTHTVCSCHTWGIVAVLGKFAKWSPEVVPKLFELGENSFLSVLFVAIALFFTLVYLFLKDQWGAVIMEVFTMKEYDSGRIIQMHIVFSALLAEIFFSIITFNVSPDVGNCFVLAFIFYYLLQSVFFWLFIYAVFLRSRISEIFDSEKYNSYKIYLFVGYGLPFIVTLTISGLSFKDVIDEGICWLLFQGSTVWGFSGVIVTLGVGSLCLLLTTMYQARDMEKGIILQEKCIRTIFTQFFVLLTSVFGAFALKDRTFFAEYCFSLCNLLQGFSIAVMYCILKREDPIIKANQVGPVPDWATDEEKKFEDYTPEFKDMDGERSDDENEDDTQEENEKGDDKEIEEQPFKRYRHIQDGSAIFLQERKFGDVSDEECHVDMPSSTNINSEDVIEAKATQSTFEQKVENEERMTDKKEEESFANINRFLVKPNDDDDGSDQEIDFRFDEIEMVHREYQAD